MATEEFAGKIALVTGGGSGIGRATALAFAEAGAKVAVDDIADGGGRETVRLIEQAGGKAIYIHADVRDENEVQAMVETIVATFGRLDFAFNNAGISGGARLDEFWDSATFNDTFAINARGVFYCLKHEIAQMLRQGSGAIVNTASVSGMAGPGHPSYVGAKHAVVGMTRTVGMAYAAQGIRVNAVCPGAIDTPMVQRVMRNNPANIKLIEAMHPMQRIGQASEIADAVLFLCSDRAGFITGHPLAVDGGRLAG
ncbi:MAG: family oxidoreductase [Rhodospirillales bacterium]|nr:family oxidoreductase [Rhodospirillales bacterium]